MQHDIGMNSGDFISGKLCYLRALSYARALEMRRDFPDAIELTSEVIVHREYFESQQWWKQEEIRAIAVGMAAYRAVLVGKAAARVTGIPVLRNGPVELCLPGGVCAPSRKRWQTGVEYRHWQLHDDDWTIHKGVRVTRGRRTVIDIARTGTLAEGLAAIDYVLYTQQTNMESIDAQLSRFRRLPGVSKARRAMELASPRAESPLESWARAQLIEAGIHDFFLQIEIEGCRVDFLIQEWLVVEVDGKSKYTDFGEEKKWAEEKERNDKILAAGYHILHVGRKELKTMVQGESEFIHKVRKLLQRRPR